MINRKTKKRLVPLLFQIIFYLFIPGSSCKDPLGLQTGFLETRDIKTSSSASNFTATDPWCSTKADDKQFIAFDLGEDFSLSKVAIQGKIDDKNRYIEAFTMDYSSDAKKWSEYKDIFGKSVSSFAQLYLARQTNSILDSQLFIIK